MYVCMCKHEIFKIFNAVVVRYYVAKVKKSKRKHPNKDVFEVNKSPTYSGFLILFTFKRNVRSSWDIMFYTAPVKKLKCNKL